MMSSSPLPHLVDGGANKLLKVKHSLLKSNYWYVRSFCNEWRSQINPPSRRVDKTMCEKNYNF